MGEHFLDIVLVAVTASTGVCGVTKRGTGGVGDNTVIVHVLCAYVILNVGAYLVAAHIIAHDLNSVGDNVGTVISYIKACNVVVAYERCSIVLTVNDNGVFYSPGHLVPGDADSAACILVGSYNVDVFGFVSYGLFSSLCYHKGERESERKHKHNGEELTE